jgi:RND family efflux transporter MFP subunit
LRLEKTKIYAPFSGIITDIQVSPNENVSAGTVLFTLVNIDRVQVNAKVLESEIGKMVVGREVDLKFSAYPGEVMPGKVSAISPVVNPDDKTCTVIIDVPNPQARIKPGMHAEVEIAAEIYHDRLLVPQDAVLTRGGRKLVFAVEDGMAKWKYIQIGLENEDFAEVLPDENGEIPVTEGMQLLVEGHFTIAHDANVRVIE